MSADVSEFEVSTVNSSTIKHAKNLIHELSTNPNLEKFKQEYEKLYRGQEKSLQNEQRLLKKVSIHYYNNTVLV